MDMDRSRDDRNKDRYAEKLRDYEIKDERYEENDTASNGYDGM